MYETLIKETGGFRSSAPNQPSCIKLIFLLLLGIGLGFMGAALLTYPSLMEEAIDEEIAMIIYNNTSETVENDPDAAEVHAVESKALAEKLYNEVRVLCWVMINPADRKTIGSRVLSTWGHRCNDLLFFMSNEHANDETANYNDTVVLPAIAEGQDKLWPRTKAAINYLNANRTHDWYLKVDEDTYVIMENLRKMLYPYQADFPLSFSTDFKYHDIDKQNYLAGGAEYILSRGAIELMAEQGLTDNEMCSFDNTLPEYEEIRKCLKNLGVVNGDARDEEGKSRFYAFIPNRKPFPLVQDLNDHQWYWKYIFYESTDVEKWTCCSSSAISFHYVKPNDLRVMEYLIYELRPYGLVTHSKPLPPKYTEREMLAMFDPSLSGQVLSEK